VIQVLARKVVLAARTCERAVYREVQGVMVGQVMAVCASERRAGPKTDVGRGRLRAGWSAPTPSTPLRFVAAAFFVLWRLHPSRS
jgi:hypothetical protein